MIASEHSSSDFATQPLICKQNFLTVSLHLCLLLAFFPLFFFFPPHPTRLPFASSPLPQFPLSLLSFRQGEAGPKGRKGEVCRIRLCSIRCNPFCLILRRGEKPCQACVASIEDLQSQYPEAWGNLAPWAKKKKREYTSQETFLSGDAHI